MASGLRRAGSAFAVAVFAASLLAGCGGDGDRATDGDGAPGATSTTAAGGGGTTGPPTTAAPAQTAPPPSPSTVPAVRLREIARLDQPLALATLAGDDRLYVAEKGGRVRLLAGGRVESRPVLDISDEVSTGSEQGLLGIAFAPDRPLLYLNYTDREGDTHVVEFAVRGGVADEASRRELLSVDQPFANHNGGQVLFGPDGLLYIGLGDGGSAGDPQGNGQRLDTLLGKLLRIDPRPSGDRPYSIPGDNPFVSRPGARPEIWAYGLRNPWRFSFDRGTSDLWIGDVGQNRIEEVNLAPAGSGGGRNYGWNAVEGTRPFRGARPRDAVDPVHEYPLSDGNCAVTGGYAYRGSRVAGLQGAYLFADFCAGNVMVLVREGQRFTAVPLRQHVDQLASFGEDAAGEVYALSLSGGIFRVEPS